MGGFGNNVYTASLDGLDDGEYTLAVTGTILGGTVGIQLNPESRNIIVNAVAPTLQFLNPINGIIEDSDPEASGVQTIVVLEACGLGGQTVTVSNSIAPEAEPLALEVPVGEGVSYLTCPRRMYPWVKFSSTLLPLTFAVLRHQFQLRPLLTPMRSSQTYFL